MSAYLLHAVDVYTGRLLWKQKVAYDRAVMSEADSRATLSPPGSNFLYSGWVTESNHLGNVAYRTGKKLEWDYVNLRARNAPEADQFIRRPYRKGWDGILT